MTPSRSSASLFSTRDEILTAQRKPGQRRLEEPEPLPQNFRQEEEIALLHVIQPCVAKQLAQAGRSDHVASAIDGRAIENPLRHRIERVVLEDVDLTTWRHDACQFAEVSDLLAVVDVVVHTKRVCRIERAVRERQVVRFLNGHRPAVDGLTNHWQRDVRSDDARIPGEKRDRGALAAAGIKQSQLACIRNLTPQPPHEHTTLLMDEKLVVARELLAQRVGQQVVIVGGEAIEGFSHRLSDCESWPISWAPPW